MNSVQPSDSADVDDTVGMVRKVPQVDSDSTASSPIAADAGERLIKSAERVRDLGEVFTPRQTVADMLDLLPDDVWAAFPPTTFLEPACGDGNFVVAVLERKLARVAADWVSGVLPAGADVEALWFHGLAALSSVYGVDISVDNIVGGSPEHPVGARDRVAGVFADWIGEVTGSHPAARSKLLRCADWIIDANLIVGDMLPVDASGRARSLAGIPLVEYRWDADRHRVSLVFTSMQQVIDEARESVSDQPSLFGVEPASPVWSGGFLDLHRHPAPSHTEGSVSGSREGVL